MRKCYQDNWFGIDFKSFAKLDPNNIADVSFYDKFYDEFYKKFKSYDELPDDWKSEKKAVADLILRLSNKNDRLLSIGCGNGFVEYLINKEGRNITAIEPSTKATKFLREFSDVCVLSGYFPQCLKDFDSNYYDLAYMSAIEYCFTDDELLDLLVNIRDADIKSFVLISASIEEQLVVRMLKEKIKQILYFLKIRKRQLGQFWGYQRTPQELKKLFLTAGFKNIKDGYIGRNQFWIMGEK